MGATRTGVTPRALATTLGVLAAIAACHPADKAPAPAADSAHAATAAAPVDTTPVIAPPNWTRIPWQPFSDARGTLDYGTGIVALRLQSDSGRSFPYTDTLVFLDAPDPRARPVGALLQERPQAGEWAYAALAPAGMRPNFLEYAYEESGVPIDSTDATRAWVRGLIATDRAGVMLTGWARLDSARLTLLEWPEHLPSQRLTFRDTSRALLYGSREDADANRNGVKLPSSRYTMDGLAADGPFLRVNFQWPFEACEDADSVRHTSRELWIRYLDARQRPLVFYASRGC